MLIIQGKTAKRVAIEHLEADNECDYCNKIHLNEQEQKVSVTARCLVHQSVIQSISQSVIRLVKQSVGHSITRLLNCQ